MKKSNTDDNFDQELREVLQAISGTLTSGQLDQMSAIATSQQPHEPLLDLLSRSLVRAVPCSLLLCIIFWLWSSFSGPSTDASLLLQTGFAG